MIEACQLVMPLPEADFIHWEPCHIHPRLDARPSHLRGDALGGDSCLLSPSLQVLVPDLYYRGLFILEEVGELTLDLWYHRYPSLWVSSLDPPLC